MANRQRLIDDVLAGNVFLPEWITTEKARMIDSLRGVLLSAQVFVADNVAEYLYAGTDQEEWDAFKDFPLLAPPYPVFWFEYRRPSRITSTAGNQSSSGLPWQVGHLFTGEEISGIDLSDRIPTGDQLKKMQERAWKYVGALMVKVGQAKFIEMLGSVKSKQSRNEPLTPEEENLVLMGHMALHGSKMFNSPEESISSLGAKWVVTVTQFTQLARGGPVMCVCPAWVMFVNEDGKLNSERMHIISDLEPSMLIDRDAEIRALTREMSCWRHPSLLALSLLHCKNVSVSDSFQPETFNRVWRRKHGQSLKKYKVLCIEPMKEVIRARPEDGREKVQMALHFCRGHFKDYRQKGLFGKFQGVFWWDSFLRGKAEHGIVEKDYCVHPGN